MISDTPKYRFGTWGPVVISALALILVAAAGELDASWERLKAMPKEERARLLANLRKFDLELLPEQQSAVREIDRRLSQLSVDERAHYIAVLKRYHAWLNGLPEMRQDELASKPPGERLALVRKLIVDRPVPFGDTPQLSRIIEPGEYNPFEVASAYKIWQALDADLRSDVEKKTPERFRREYLFKVGARPKFKIPRETIPDDFDDEKWGGSLKRTIPPIGVLEELVKKKVDETAKKRLDETAKKRFEAHFAEILRRQAINLYVSEANVRPVDPERLTRFIAGLPPWIPSSFDALPPDEARWRMTVAYRQVFPGANEIGATKKPATTPGKVRETPAKKPSAPTKTKRKSTDSGENPTPF
jgi:hypothetical protein